MYNIPRLTSFSVHATITLTSDKMIFYLNQLPAPSFHVPLVLKTGITHVRASRTRAETLPLSLPDNIIYQLILREKNQVDIKRNPTPFNNSGSKKKNNALRNNS